LINGIHAQTQQVSRLSDHRQAIYLNQFNSGHSYQTDEYGLPLKTNTFETAVGKLIVEPAHGSNSNQIQLQAALVAAATTNQGI